MEARCDLDLNPGSHCYKNSAFTAELSLYLEKC